MTKYDRDLSRSSQSSPTTTGNPSENFEGCNTDLLEASLQAHDLANHSQKNVSMAKLYESGTWAKYEQRAKSLARKHPSRDPFRAYLICDEHGTFLSSNSRQSYRSALVRLAARDVLELAPPLWHQILNLAAGEDKKRDLERTISAYIDGETWDHIQQASGNLSNVQLRKLERAVEFIITVQPDPDHTALRHRSRQPSSTETKSGSSTSKNSTLYKLNQHQRRRAKVLSAYDWRSHFWNAAVMSDTHLDDRRRACIAAMMLTGCRPSELCDDLGVTVDAVGLEENQRLAFEIAGSKCIESGAIHPGKGQERRYIEIVCKTPEAAWLFDHVAEQPDRAVRLFLGAPTYDRKGIELMATERRRRVSDQLGKLIARLGKVAFPRLNCNLSPYVFRHALASDLRASAHQFNRCGIASALGHQSEKTQQHYGSPNTSKGLNGSRAVQITHVSATSPVRAFERARIGQKYDATPE
ncbi:site-specific integrase [Roseovarius atlanticus]|uniref:site-specific integrase n=1 Tax=Roseovarius atlanticus TaxID=1641875 RepID=UPI000B02490F|nr:site-specific integrase [Roseovarius atlanticus]